MHDPNFRSRSNYLAVKPASYGYDQRVVALDLATAAGSGLVMEIGTSSTRYWADPEVKVGFIEVYAPKQYKGMPEYVETLSGAAPDWVSPQDEKARETMQRIVDGLEPHTEWRPPFTIDAAHLDRQFAFSQRTYGPGARFAGVIDHIRHELVELEEVEGIDVTEWIDVAILAFDGALRQGFKPQQILDALLAKQIKNEGRIWPDWRTQDPEKAIEHDRSAD